MSAPAQQLVEWVDDDGRVLGIVARSRVRAENLLHRSVFVAVRSVAGGELLVHRRAAWKDVWPGYWDLAAGGLCAVGEPWAAAARRELAEELGIEVVDLEELGIFSYRDRQVAELAHVYVVRHDGPFRFDDGEVTDVAWVALDQLDDWCAGRAVCPDSAAGVRPLLTK
jgi:isopentenyldiphosphate isomerase